MTLTATVETKIELPPESHADLVAKRWMLRGYSIFGALVAPLAVLATLYWGVMGNKAVANLPESQIYLFVVPILACTAMLAVFGVLSLVVQRPWAVIACGAVGCLVTISYLAPALQQRHNLLSFTALVFFAIPVALLSFIPLTRKAVKQLPPKDLHVQSKIHKVGTLRYTTFGLAMCFIWLLWGDFAHALFDTHMPNILVFKLKDLGASDFLNMLLNKTLANVVVFIFAPAVSFHSDRYRGKWGRRLPYLFWSTPFVGGFLVLIGCYEPLTQLITGGQSHITILGMEVSSLGISLILFAVLYAAWDFANIFVGTLYWYLFNDVVPSPLMSQFLSLFRVVGTLAGMFYSKWIFPIVLDHFQFLFVTFGICYVIGFMLMCVMVREGKYAPPPPLIAKPTGKSEAFFKRMIVQMFRQPGYAFLAAFIIPFLTLASINGNVLATPLISRVLADHANILPALQANPAQAVQIIEQMHSAIIRDFRWIMLPIVGSSFLLSALGIIAWLRGSAWATVSAALAGIVVAASYFVPAHLQDYPESSGARIAFSLPLAMTLLLPAGWLIHRLLRKPAPVDPAQAEPKQSKIIHYLQVGPVVVGRRVDALVAQAHTYSKECFTHKFYWLFFLQSIFFNVSWQAGIYLSLRNRDYLGLTLTDLGELGAITAGVSLLLQYPAGWLSDKWNPIRVFTLTTWLTFGQQLFQCLFIFYNFGRETNLLIMYWLAFTVMPFSLLHGAAEIPMYMRLLPKERYGQFCSANAMLRSFGMIVGSIIAGLGMESLKGLGDYRYTFYPVWAVVFQIPAFLFLWMLYREWMRRGGDKGYVPPGFENSQTAASGDAPRPIGGH